MGVVWFVVDALLAAVARAAMWVIEQTSENTERLASHNFEHRDAGDQNDPEDG